MEYNYEKEEILVPFRTWRNTNTGQAAAALSELFVYNIPLRYTSSIPVGVAIKFLRSLRI